MQEIFSQVMAHVRSTWRYRWFMILIACPLTIGGWIWVQALPDKYEASTRVYIDTNSVLVPLMAGLTVGNNVSRQIDFMTRTLLSRPNMEKLARMTDMDLKAKTPDQMHDVVDGLAQNIRIAEVTGVQDLYTIKYEDRDPQLAKKVVQSLLTIFVESTLGSSRSDSDTAQSFLDKQIKEYEDRLAAAEDRLKQFKRKNIGLMPGQGGDYYQNLQSAIGELEQAKMQLQEGQDRRQELQRQLEDQDSAPSSSFSATTAGASMTPELDSRINNLQSRLDELLLKYTDQHPDVIEVKRTIANLEKQKQEVLAAQAKSSQGKGDSQPTNPYQAQLKLAVNEADANVAALKARVDARQQQIDQLKKMVNILPEVEEQLKQLNRDYDVTKSSYESLLQRRESANMSQEMDQNAETVKFRIVDPPFVPPTPSSPNRPLMSSEALLAGIAAGIVFAIFLAQLNPTFDSRRALMEATNLPVLGGVSMIWTAAQMRRKHMDVWGFGLAIVILLGVYSAVMAMQILNINPISHIKGLL